MLLSLVVGASVEIITAQCPLTVEPPSSRLPHSAEALQRRSVTARRRHHRRGDCRKLKALLDCRCGCDCGSTGCMRRAAALQIGIPQTPDSLHETGCGSCCGSATGENLPAGARLLIPDGHSLFAMACDVRVLRACGTSSWHHRSPICRAVCAPPPHSIANNCPIFRPTFPRSIFLPTFPTSRRPRLPLGRRCSDNC